MKDAPGTLCRLKMGISYINSLPILQNSVR
jgi:hypothetical protein